jgi:hypothetical protein
MLRFAPLSDAFRLGSDQIKDTQQEIARLSKIISDSTLSKQSNPTKEPPPPNEKRILPEKKFEPITNNDLSDSDILKIIQHPKFENVVKSYMIVKHPEYFQKETIKENFGKNGGVINKCIVFFVISILFYIYLKNIFNE